jgi:hypothetical protein
MSVHADREAFYKRYDAAVARLPEALRKDASFTNCGEDRHGIHFYDGWGQKTAIVPEQGDITLLGQVVEKSTESATPENSDTTKRPPYASHDFVKKSVLAALRRVGVKLKTVYDALIAIDERLKDLEGSRVAKSLDLAALDEMAAFAQRLEQLENAVAEMEDHGFRYRGFWRDGLKAKRGDAFTHDGSLWYASRATNDRPCNESADWAVVARKGRDAR